MFLHLNAPVSATSTLTIDAPLSMVWKTLVDIEAWPTWNPDIRSVSVEGSVTPGATFRWKAGGVQIVSMIQEMQHEERIVWTGETIGIRAVHEWQLKETEYGVVVETHEVFGGWLAKLMSGRLEKMLQHSLDSGLQHLKREAEQRQTQS